MVTHGYSVWLVSGCFLLGWLIYGSVMVFSRMEHPSQDQPNYCQFSAHMFAYISIIFRKSTSTYKELFYLDICQFVRIF